MKKIIYVLSAVAVAVIIVSFSLPAGVADRIIGKFAACSMEKSQPAEISVTGKLISAKEWSTGNAECAECSMNATATPGECPASAGECPYNKAEKGAAATAAEVSGDCCAGEKAEKTASAEYGIVDAQGHFYLALATEKVCNESLESHSNKTVRLNGTRTVLNGLPAIAGVAIEEIR